MHLALLALGAFLASAVEMVEALTIVLAVGVTRGWRAVALGSSAAFVALAAVVGALGPALTQIPIDALRVAVGGLLLVFGLQWLRKAVLRASGLKALHDEAAIYARELAELGGATDDAPRGAMDWYGFTVAFKGVFLEGLEVAFIVVTFGSTQGHVGIAALAAVAALVVVAIAGAFLHRPLTRVPENTLKFGVGVMLTSFGMFWAAEGAGAHWPGGDTFILFLVLYTAGFSLGLVAWLRRQRPAAPATTQGQGQVIP
ncbi:MAG: hypothetical protein JWL73_1461 [Actinomycetia bacterium]|nr:hypothetical protein [Actinomycetes bacterium]